MRRFFLVILVLSLPATFLHAEESSFKFTFGSNIGKIPLVINRVSKNIMTSPGININSWILSPNFSSLAGDKKKLNFSSEKNLKENFYIKLNIKF